MPSSARHRLTTAFVIAAVLVAWQIAGAYDLVASGALPAPLEIAVRVWLDRHDYAPHILATVKSAFVGFVLGNVAAIGAAILFVRVPLAEQLARGINITIFALPPIAIVPVLVLAMEGDWPRITLAALAVYFPTMTAMSVGLRDVDPRIIDVVRAYGGGDNAVMRWVRLRSSLPALLGGLRLAAPNAVLGAMLAEFGSGARWGLGTYLLASLGRGEPDRLWGIGLIATAVAGIAYAIPALIGARIIGHSRAVTIAAGAVPRPAPASRHDRARRVLLLAGAIAAPFLLWWALVAWSGLPAMIVKSPWAVAEYLLSGPAAEGARSRLFTAAAETLPAALIGMAVGLLFAFLLAALGFLFPPIVHGLLPIALVTQSMPLVALTPLLVLLLGRGTAITIAITVSVTFFPAFVTLAQGLALVSPAAFELVRAYGGSGLKQLGLVGVPASLPYLFAAAKLTVPRALLGVMVAEWLATGGGLGGLLNQSRGYLDYAMIWTVAAVSVILSVAFYQLIALAESGRRRRK